MTLSEIAKVKFGYHATPSPDGSINYIQAKHFDDNALMIQPISTFIESTSRLKNHLLEPGDVLLAGKGFRKFAWTYQENVCPSIASSMFFVIKPDKKRVLSSYLTIFLNTNQIQKHFQTLGAGSSIPSIRKSELEALPVTLPSLDMQEKIDEISRMPVKVMNRATNQNRLRDKDIDKIVKTYRVFQEATPLTTEEGQVIEEKYAYCATIQEVKENEYNLNIPRYVDTFEEEVDIAATQTNIIDLKKELAVVEEKMENYLKELGF